MAAFSHGALVELGDRMTMKRIVRTVLLLITSCSFGQDGLQLKWKFPDGVTYTYEYTQSTVCKADYGVESPDPRRESRFTIKGPVTVSCHGGSATLDYSFTIQPTVSDEQTTPKQPPEMPFAFDKGPFRPIGSCLFPLPKGPLEKGKEVTEEEVSKQTAIPQTGDLIKETGHTKYIYEGLKVVNGMRCAAYHYSYAHRTYIEPRDRAIYETKIGMEADCLFAVDKGHLLSWRGDMNVEVKLGEQSDPALAITNAETSLILKAVGRTSAP